MVARDQKTVCLVQLFSDQLFWKKKSKQTGPK
jgi:hypothetical protein